MAFKMRTSKPEAGNKYYITKANGGYSDAIKGSPTDKDCDVLSNCVGYAYGRFNEIGGYGYCKYLRPVNAENFIQYKGTSLKTGQTPKLGACMVWQKGATLNGSDGAGHVAIVEKVVSDTEVYTSESGWGSSNPFWNKTRTKGNGNWGQGAAYKFLGFIYNPAVSDEKPVTTVPSTSGGKMKYSSTNRPLECMMTQSTCYKGTSTMTVKGVLWHSTGANNPNLRRYVQPDDSAANRAELLALLGTNGNRNDWNHINRQAGLNCWIGKLADGTVTTVQTMPWNYRPWGCGSGNKGSCNNGWIQFEICEDGLNDATYFNKVYKEACEITAYLCKMFNIDPNGMVNMNGVSVPTILCHADSHALGLGSNHGDVNHWFPKFGKSMATARADVAALMKTSGSVAPTQPTNPTTPTTSAFKAGDVVKIIGTQYYSGQSVPGWVRAKNWIVHSVSGNRVVINKSEDGKNSIMSPFKASDLALANANPTTPTTSAFKAGDVVKIIGTQYYSGQSVPGWVRAKNWIVHSVSGNRVVINKSEDGKNSIMSPFKASDLALANANPTTPTIPSTPSAPSGNTNEEIIWSFLLGKIGNEYGVAGMMGNLYAESGLRPDNLQNAYEKRLGYTDASYTAAVDNGTYKKFGTDSAGYGLAQWTYHTRKKALLAFAQSKKKSVGDLGMQLEFLYKELSESYKGVFADLKSAKTILAASNSVLMKFERPANQSAAVQNKRAAYGQKFYDKYAGKTPVVPEQKPSAVPYRVRVTADVLNIRKGAGTGYAVAGQIKGGGVYTIVEEKDGTGAKSWGKLKSGAGWISLDYTSRV